MVGEWKPIDRQDKSQQFTESWF